MNASRIFFPLASSRQRALAALLALFTGAFLAAGFLGVSTQLADWLSPTFLPNQVRPWLECLAFPFLAAVFYLSFPRPHFPSTSFRAIRSWPFGVIVALVFGWLHESPGLFSLVPSAEIQLALAWTLVLAPIGEEFLFRGWVFSLAHRFWPGVFASATNPLPLSVWVSAFAFSIWHTQNLESGFLAEGIFQILYAFPLGLWLGWLRVQTGTLWVPVLTHISINFAAALF
jgi:membrane protease YdiL (CAAX protease family)